MKGFIEITREDFAGDCKPLVMIKQLININSIASVSQVANFGSGKIIGCTITLTNGEEITTGRNADIYDEVKKVIEKALPDTL